MDAIKNTGFAILLSLFTVACNQGKTSSSVFPDNNNNNALSSCAQQTSQNRFIVQWENGEFSVVKNDDVENFRENFVNKNLDQIKHVDRDIQIQLHTESNPKTNNFTAFENPKMNWGPELIQAPDLWNNNINGEGVIVAVVDGMVDTSHQQLINNLFINEKEIPNNRIDDDKNGFIDDYYGVQVNKEKNDPDQNIHGTHVAGIIAADPKPGLIFGVAPKAKILAAQFINNQGAGNIGDAIIAMNYAAKYGAKILNLSWGAGTCVQIPNLKTALEKLSNDGILIVTAAGNGDGNNGVGYSVDQYPSYPSAYNFANQINVAAIDQSDYLVSFSNYGAKTVHVAAPGVDIYSTIPNNQIEYLSGTSMSAPMVSGAAALLWSAFPQSSAGQIKEALMRSVDIIPGRILEVASRGRINVSAAYIELQKILKQ